VIKFVWCTGDDTSTKVMFVSFLSNAVVNYVANYTLDAVDSMFLTGSVIKKHWIVCVHTEHGTGILTALDVEDVTINSLIYLITSLIECFISDSVYIYLQYNLQYSNK
jgi:hypothetical protein